MQKVVPWQQKATGERADLVFDSSVSQNHLY